LELLADADRYIGWPCELQRAARPIAGILIADYFVLRRTKLNLDALYDRRAEFATPTVSASSGWRRWLRRSCRNLPGFSWQVKWLGSSQVPAVLGGQLRVCVVYWLRVAVRGLSRVAKISAK